MTDVPVTKVKTRTGHDPLVMLDQQLALGAYLDALLTPALVEADASAVTETRVEARVDNSPAAVSSPQTRPRIAEETVDQADIEIDIQQESRPYPAWAEGDFQCLLFKVAGLSLAVPLAKLNGVVPWDDAAVVELPNHSRWFLGLRDYQGQRVRLIDLAAVILPADRYAELGAADSDRLGRIVLIDDAHWGLACEEIGEVVTLTAEAVKWRTVKGQRPWLAGTVIDHMCALLDTDAFARMLRDSGPER